jgi:hypothetical protein
MVFMGSIVNRLVVAALIYVGEIPSYHNKWIAGYDWSDIIKHAYSSMIPPTGKFKEESVFPTIKSFPHTFFF